MFCYVCHHVESTTTCDGQTPLVIEPAAIHWDKTFVAVAVSVLAAQSSRSAVCEHPSDARGEHGLSLCDEIEAETVSRQRQFEVRP